MNSAVTVRSGLDSTRLEERGSGDPCEAAVPAVGPHTGKVCIAI